MQPVFLIVRRHHGIHIICARKDLCILSWARQTAVIEKPAFLSFNGRLLPLWEKCPAQRLSNPILNDGHKSRQRWFLEPKPSTWQIYTLRKHSLHTDEDAHKQNIRDIWKGLTHAHTHTQIAFKRHLPSCDHEAFRCYPPMNIKYKHSSKFSTPGLYFMPLSWHNKHISFSLPNSAPKMNLSPLYKIICQHYMCWWIIHEGSWRVSAPYESWRKPSWQTPRFCTRTGSRERKVEDLVKRICFWKWYTAPCIHSEGYLFTQAWGQFKWRCRIISSLLNCHNWFKWNDF